VYAIFVKIWYGEIMKKIIWIIIFIFALTNNSNSEMFHSVSEDEFKGTKNHYIMTDSVKANKSLSFPYEDTQSTLVVGCTNNNYWAYIYFTKVNLTGGKINDGYTLFTLKVKAGGDFKNIFATQDFGSNNLNFNMTGSDKKEITNLMRNHDEVWIQFNHYQDGKRFYKYDTRGFSKLFDKNCKKQLSISENKIGLTLSEENELKSQIFQCWSIPLGLPNNEDLVVRIKLKFKPDGSVLNSEILDSKKMKVKYFKVWAESVIRAVKLCEPLRVPNGIEEITLNFDVGVLLSG